MLTLGLAMSLLLLVREDESEDIDERSLDSDSPLLPILLRPNSTRGMRTYLAHSSPTAASVTKFPMSAVGAYTAPKLNMSRSTTQP
jgi:hypothetical protein